MSDQSCMITKENNCSSGLLQIN